MLLRQIGFAFNFSVAAFFRLSALMYSPLTIAVIFLGVPSIALSATSKATALPLACFLSDGTLAKVTSGQLSLTDPVSDSTLYAAPQTKNIRGVLCNPKKLQALVLYDEENWNWGTISIDSGKIVLSRIPTKFISTPEYYYRNYNNTFYHVKPSTYGYARGVSYSADGEFIAAYKHFGWTNRVFLSVFKTADFSEIASINLRELLGTPYGGSKLLAINKVTDQYVDIMATTKGDANDFKNEENIQNVRWQFRDGQITKSSLETNIKAISQGPRRGAAFWDFNPLVGGFIAGKSGKIIFLNSNNDDSPIFGQFTSTSSNHFPIAYGSWIIGPMTGITIGEQYASDGSTRVNNCEYTPYIFKAGENDFKIMPCNSLDPWGAIAVDVQRGYIFNSSRGKPDRLLKIEDFSDVREAYFKSLQKKYSVNFRKAFAKAEPKERYVPSVSNSNTVGETLFYINNHPVTRYKNYTTINEGYTEKVDIYNLVYEVRNNYTKPLLIKFRVEGLAKSTSWVVKTLPGDVFRALLGGRLNDENVREKEVVSLPLKIEKTLILRPGEAFKSKDVWGEFPENLNEISIRAFDIQEIDPAWLNRLNGLLSGKIPPTQDRVNEFISDPRSSWATEKLLELKRKAQTNQNRQHTKKLMQGIKLGSISFPDDYDPDFENNIAIELQNNNAVEVNITLQIGKTSVTETLPAGGKKVISAKVSGIKKAEIIPVIKSVH